MISASSSPKIRTASVARSPGVPSRIAPRSRITEVASTPCAPRRTSTLSCKRPMRMSMVSVALASIVSRIDARHVTIVDPSSPDLTSIESSAAAPLPNCAASSSRLSADLPPSTKSLPSPTVQRIVSAPTPPITTSSPTPPTSRFTPDTPCRRSLPSCPYSWSRPAPAFSLSSPS